MRTFGFCICFYEKPLFYVLLHKVEGIKWKEWQCNFMMWLVKIFQMKLCSMYMSSNSLLALQQLCNIVCRTCKLIMEDNIDGANNSTQSHHRYSSHVVVIRRHTVPSVQTLPQPISNTLKRFSDLHLKFIWHYDKYLNIHLDNWRY